MDNRKMGLALATMLAFAACSPVSQSPAENPEAERATANQLVKQGRADEAVRIFIRLTARPSRDYSLYIDAIRAARATGNRVSAGAFLRLHDAADPEGYEAARLDLRRAMIVEPARVPTLFARLKNIWTSSKDPIIHLLRSAPIGILPVGDKFLYVSECFDPSTTRDQAWLDLAVKPQHQAAGQAATLEIGVLSLGPSGKPDDRAVLSGITGDGNIEELRRFESGSPSRAEGVKAMSDHVLANTYPADAPEAKRPGHTASCPAAGPPDTRDLFEVIAAG